MITISKDLYSYKVCITSDKLIIPPDAMMEALLDGEKKLIDENDKNFSALNAYRKCIDYGLNNHWDYFITITIDDKKQDINFGRKILSLIQKQFNYYRNYYDDDFRYLIIPEYGSLHGRLHFHGLVKMTFNKKFLKFMKFDNKHSVSVYRHEWFYKHIGACQFTKINYESPQIIGYISKYITKDSNKIFDCFYFCSKGLCVSVKKVVNRIDRYDDFVKSLFCIKADSMTFSNRFCSKFEIPLDKLDELNKVIEYYGGVYE